MNHLLDAESNAVATLILEVSDAQEGDYVISAVKDHSIPRIQVFVCVGTRAHTHGLKIANPCPALLLILLTVRDNINLYCGSKLIQPFRHSHIP